MIKMHQEPAQSMEQEATKRLARQHMLDLSACQHMGLYPLPPTINPSATRMCKMQFSPTRVRKPTRLGGLSCHLELDLSEM